MAPRTPLRCASLLRRSCRSTSTQPATWALSAGAVGASEQQHAKPLSRRGHASLHGGSEHGNGNGGSVSSDEMSHFTALADRWWDPLGPSRVLHLMNPLRHEFIQRCLQSTPTTAGGGGGAAGNDTTGLDYLDIGCGGGIFAESLARTIPLESGVSSGVSPVTRARSITAIDPAPTMIKVATEHAREDPTVHFHLQSGVFKYRTTSLEDMISHHHQQSPIPTPTPTPSFDIITLFEVIEHLDAPSSHPHPHPHSTPPPLAFLQQIFSLLRPGGWLVGSTMARTPLTYLIHKLIGEAPWPVGVVPPGTHDWHKFIDPVDLKRWAVRALRENAWAGEEEGDGKGGRGRKRGGDPAFSMGYESVGAVYMPGLGWRFVDGAENLGNYFFAIRKG